MGEEFIRKHTDHFRISKDAAYEREVKTRHLFSERPEIFESRFRCRVADGTVSIGPNDYLVAAQTGNADIAVLRGNVQVATIGGGEAAELRDAFRAEPRACGMVGVQVVQPPGPLGYFTVALRGQGAGA